MYERLLELRQRLHNASVEFQGRGAIYDSALTGVLPCDQAAREYDDAARRYLLMLKECEHYLRSIERDEQTEYELQKVLRLEEILEPILGRLG